MGSIITLRFILITASNIISLIGSYYIALPCFKIDSMMDEQEALLSHPDCIAYYNGTNPSQHSVTSADFVGNVSETAASLDLSFGTALWLALAVHAIGVEIYVSGALTSNATMLIKASSHSPRANQSDSARSPMSGRPRPDLRIREVRD